MSIGLSSAMIAFLLGGALGVAAGYAGARVDMLVEFLINLFLSVPQLPIMIVIGAFFGQSSFNIICVIAAFSSGHSKTGEGQNHVPEKNPLPHSGQKLREGDYGTCSELT